MIQEKDGYFLLDTKRTSYAFRVMESGHLEHIHYGHRLDIDMMVDAKSSFAPFIEKREFLCGNGISYSEEFPNLGLEDVQLEISSYGKGDIREPFIQLIFDDGSSSSDFLFVSSKIAKGKVMLKSLPSSYAKETKAEQLYIVLKDRHHDILLTLVYSVFSDCDVIVRSVKLSNESGKIISIKRLMSTQVDFDETGLIFTSFTGAWAREMNRQDHVCASGLFVNHTMTGNSSNRANPFVMVSPPQTTETAGLCYGFNLVYSANHYEALEVNAFGKSRFISGISPIGFTWLLEAGGTFEAPEAVMTFSACGYEGVSHQMHEFVREHIVRGEWKYKERPILLNSWEASYFKFNESRLLKLAKAGKEQGIELFVMDDGWFGKREDDTSSLGDWEVNRKKLPGGIKGLADKINTLGMKFGLWVEPEMVNENSNLYRTHPDWAVRIPGQSHSLGRNQMILDLTKKEVREYLILCMTNVFSEGNTSYVKWDMNRIFSDNYTNSLSSAQQGEFSHRYICGLYEVLTELLKRFPHILFESCASGGNRFDLGMLCYMPQIWASDNTDAICRLTIQQGYSYGYPLSVIGAHVSGCPNHQTLRNTPLMTRFHIACFGLLGYECNLAEMPKEELVLIKEQIELYKQWRSVFQYGTFYRLRDGSNADAISNPQGSYHWLCVSRDKDKAICLTAQTKTIPNMGYERILLRGLNEDRCYHFYNIPRKVNVKDFGDLINMLSPIHIKKDSITHNLVSRFVKLDGEKEDYLVKGDNLNHIGIKLSPAFAGTGFNENTRFYPDFASRLYFMESSEIKD